MTHSMVDLCIIEPSMSASSHKAPAVVTNLLCHFMISEWIIILGQMLAIIRI